MKKTFSIIIISILPLLVCAQERFYDLYPGWEIRHTKEVVGGYIFAGTDTLDMGIRIPPFIIKLIIWETCLIPIDM